MHDIDTTAGGSLDAMMLDMKRTFDEVVVAHPTPEKAEQILANPFYQAVSSSFAGTQEYMAMEKLGQLHGGPQADEGGRVGPHRRRHAAVAVGAGLPRRPEAAGLVPRRPVHPADLGARQGRRPGRAAVFNVGIGLVSSTLSRVLGGEMLRDVQTFVGALDTMFGGFRQRADQTYALLARPDGLPRRRRARARTPCARRPTSSRGSRPSGCR